MLFMIGLGLGDEKDVTVKGLEAIKSCDKVYLEHYTAVLSTSTHIEALEALYGKSVIICDRESVESEEKTDLLLKEAETLKIAFLVVGDVFAATTHTDLFLRAKRKQISVVVIHNASIMNAASCCGLQLYKFGQTISLPLFTENWTPDSFYAKIQMNQKSQLHTLCLLDIKVKEFNVEALRTKGKMIFDPPRYMSCREAAIQLLQVEAKKQENVVTPETKCIGLARVGQQDQKIVYCTLKEMSSEGVVEMGSPLHSLIIPSDLDVIEEEMLELFQIS